MSGCDFLFYASFGFVVTSSVAIAGVLLVFCYWWCVRRRNAICRPHWDAPGHRLDHGPRWFGFGVLLLRIL